MSKRRAYRSLRSAACPVAVLGAVLGPVLLAGCTGPGKFTKAGASLAHQRMAGLKAGTEFQMAHQAFLAGDLEKAIRKVDVSLALNDTVTRSHVLKGRILIEMGDLGSALESLRLAEAIDPADPDAQYYLGLCHEHLDELELAASYYRQACELDNYNPAYAVSAAEMLVDADRVSEARELLLTGPSFEHSPGVNQMLGHIAKIEGDNLGAVEYFRSARLLAPEDTAIAEDLVNAQIAVGKYREAEAALARLLERDELRERRDLQQLYARCLMRTQRPVEARRIYQELVKDHGQSDVEAWIGMANASLVLKDENAVRRAAARVVALAPERVEGYTLFALWHRGEGRLAEAVKKLEQGLRVQPRSAETHALRGVLLAEMGRPDAAAKAFKIAARLDPGEGRYRDMYRRAMDGTVASVPTGN